MSNFTKNHQCKEIILNFNMNFALIYSISHCWQANCQLNWVMTISFCLQLTVRYSLFSGKPLIRIYPSTINRTFCFSRWMTVSKCLYDTDSSLRRMSFFRSSTVWYIYSYHVRPYARPLEAALSTFSQKGLNYSFCNITAMFVMIMV